MEGQGKPVMETRRPLAIRNTVSILMGVVLTMAGILLAGCSSGDETTLTVRDTGYTTSSSTPPSVAALASGITAEQIKQLLASYSHIAKENIEVIDHETFGDWAVAKVYASQLTNDPSESQWGVAFQKGNDAWFFKGDRVDLRDGRQAAIELRNMDAPEEVWNYFGRSPSELKQTTTTSPAGYPPFVTLCRTFITLAEQEKLAGTLPLSVMAFDELEWLRQGEVPVTVTDIQGYRLANGDLVIFFLFEKVPLDETYALSETLRQRVKARYGENGKGTIFDPSFGYIIVSKDYVNQLNWLVQSDRQRLPLDY